MIRRLVLPLLAAAALVAAGCGSDAGSGTDAASGPLALLDLAAEKGDDAESYRTEMSMKSTVPGEVMSMKGRITSNADCTRALMKMTMKEKGSAPFELDAILIDDVMYMKDNGSQFGLPAGKRWLRMEDDSLAAPSLSPSQFVRFLRESGDVNVVGTEEIRGDKTTHFRGALNLEKLAKETGGEAVKALGPAIKDAHVALDIWVAPDGLPSRYAAVVTMPGKYIGSATVIADVLEYGVPVDADEPPEDQVAELSDIGG